MPVYVERMLAHDDPLLNDYPTLKRALEGLSRYDRTDLDAYFARVEHSCPPWADCASVTFHVLQRDGNRRPRVNGLIKYMLGSVTNYCIPRSKIQEALAAGKTRNSAQRLTELDNEARGLFADVAQSGEGGELLLFLLAESYLQYPQVICKMSLKTSPKMHFHGADGVYASADPETGKFRLHWGEAKLYSDVSAAIDACVSSIAPVLNDEGSVQASKRDFNILQDFGDVADEKLQAALERFLDPDDKLYLKTEVCGICLVGFDLDQYPELPDRPGVSVSDLGFDADVVRWMNRLARAVRAKGVDSFKLDVFLLPFPSVESFRHRLRAMLHGEEA